MVQFDLRVLCFNWVESPISYIVGLAQGLEFQGDPDEFDTILNLVGRFSRFDPTKLKTMVDRHVNAAGTSHKTGAAKRYLEATVTSPPTP